MNFAWCEEQQNSQTKGSFVVLVLLMLMLFRVFKPAGLSV
jgi:hypothetical protein